MSTENKAQENKKPILTTSAKKKLVKAICQEYHAKLDQKAPKVKKDLNYTQVKDLMFLVDATKDKFKKLAFDEKIDSKDPLSKWRPEVLEQFQSHFKFDASEEDVEDIQIELGAEYEKYYHENFPESDKRISPATINMAAFMTYMGIKNKEKSLPNLIVYGVNDLGTWKLKDLKMEALNACRNFLYGDKKTA